MLFRRKQKKQNDPTAHFIVSDQPPLQYQTQQSIEVEWNGYSYNRPNQQYFPSRFGTELAALKQRLEQVKSRKRERQQREAQCLEQQQINSNLVEESSKSAPKSLQVVGGPSDVCSIKHVDSSSTDNNKNNNSSTNSSSGGLLETADQHSNKPNAVEGDAVVITVDNIDDPAPAKQIREERLGASSCPVLPLLPTSLIKRRQQRQQKLQQQQHQMQRQPSNTSSSTTNSIKSTDVQQDHAGDAHIDNFKDRNPSVSSKENERLQQERMDHFLSNNADPAVAVAKDPLTRNSTNNSNNRQERQQREQQQQSLQREPTPSRSYLPKYYEAKDDTADKARGCCIAGRTNSDNPSTSLWSMWLPDLSHTFASNSSNSTARTSLTPKTATPPRNTHLHQPLSDLSPPLLTRTPTPPSSTSIARIRTPSNHIPTGSSSIYSTPPRPPVRGQESPNLQKHAEPGSPSTQATSPGSSLLSWKSSPVASSDCTSDPPHATSNNAAGPTTHLPWNSQDACLATDRSTEVSPTTLSPPIPLTRKPTPARNSLPFMKKKPAESTERNEEAETPRKRVTLLRRLLRRKRDATREASKATAPKIKSNSKKDEWRIQPEIHPTPSATDKHKSEEILHHMEMIFYENHSDGYYDHVDPAQ